jgi:hypothetical protein
MKNILVVDSSNTDIESALRRPYASSIVKRVNSLSGAGIHHIEEKGNFYPLSSFTERRGE